MKKKQNLLSNLHNLIIERKSPVSLTHFVTLKCNAKCPHCFVDTDNNVKELNHNEIEKTASTTGNNLSNISLTGGEPFIREDLFEIADIWYKNSTAEFISIPTNGSLPDRIEIFAKKASEQNLPVSFGFSYDFPGEMHSEYRGIKDLHLKVVEAYRIIKSYGNKFNSSFQITVNEANAEQSLQAYDYIKNQIGAENITCVIVRGQNADKLTQEERITVSDSYEKLQKQIQNDLKKRILKGYSRNSLEDSVLNCKNFMYGKDILKTFRTGEFIMPCRAGTLFGVIYTDGRVFPCELLDSCIGDLKDFDYNFMNLWTSQNAKAISEKIIKDKCRCTFECVWAVNKFSKIEYYPDIAYNMLKMFFESKICRR